MSLASESDILWARERVNRLQPGQITRLAAFRDGLHLDLRHLQALERAGLVADMGDGEFWALPGMIDVFNARFGPPLGANHEVRKAGEVVAHEERAAVFAAIPAAQAQPVAERRPPARQEQGPRADRQADQGAGVVAVSVARESELHRWRGSQVIAGVDPIGAIVQKMRRST